MKRKALKLEFQGCKQICENTKTTYLLQNFAIRYGILLEKAINWPKPPHFV